MTSQEIRSRYLAFFQKRGHTILPSASLIPENDPTTLFTGSGMQPMIPYLLGETHPAGTRLTNSQTCFRAEDIEEIGDNRHTTFFEMLGNWSLGDYTKAEQLPWIFSFLTDEIGLDPKRIYVSVFAGIPEQNLPKDDEATRIWKELFATKGIEATEVDLLTEELGAERGMQGGRIFYYTHKNWWSRAGKPENMPAGEPGGPDSEIFYEFDNVEHDPAFGKHCHPNCDCGRFLEVGNSVFMEYQKQADGSFQKLVQRNIDFGGGLSRIEAASNNDPDIFRSSSLLQPIVQKIEIVSGVNYETASVPMRIIADHITAATFMIAQGLEPSNKQQGYILRRLIRRAITKAHQLGVREHFTASLSGTVADIYSGSYEVLVSTKELIAVVINKEEQKFRATLEKGLARFNRLTRDGNGNPVALQGGDLFDLYQSYGFPFELSCEVAAQEGVELSETAETEFKAEIKKHQELSRTTSAGEFKSGLGDTSEMTTKYHTATHLLHQALRTVLGDSVQQKGSNITPERLRFDFSYPEKLTEAQVAAVEKLVNEQIGRGLVVTTATMSPDEAYAEGALGFFGAKYGDVVSVYTIGDFSKEICTGPHVETLAGLGSISIIKEEAVSAGIRRIKAVLL